jgi:hypothetical protein
MDQVAHYKDVGFARSAAAGEQSLSQLSIRIDSLAMLYIDIDTAHMLYFNPPAMPERLCLPGWMIPAIPWVTGPLKIQCLEDRHRI